MLISLGSLGCQDHGSGVTIKDQDVDFMTLDPQDSGLPTPKI